MDPCKRWQVSQVIIWEIILQLIDDCSHFWMIKEMVFFGNWQERAHLLNIKPAVDENNRCK